MTDAETLSIQPGDEVSSYSNGTVSRQIVKEIVASGLCENLHSRANGHAWAMVRSDLGDNATISFLVHSDEYGQGTGYPTHDKSGNRIAGYELKRAEVLQESSRSD